MWLMANVLEMPPCPSRNLAFYNLGGAHKKGEYCPTADTWSTFLSAGTEFVTANPIVLALFAAGSVAGLLVMLVKRIGRAGR